MTAPEARPDGLAAVEQRHRDAAKQLREHVGAAWGLWLNTRDDGELVQAFARFEANHLALRPPEPATGAVRAAEAMREALETIARCGNASTDFRKVVQDIASATLATTDAADRGEKPS